ncbi:SusC/RagA family TonB-linked outer membrane protein [Hymenobacter humi]|uniref:SusC/RagA family TonB-linked outer membrane protein n=1 Tax=Hymenobacter humi TaxID=1411620 RepID=A0ABW2U6D4_9BACT
MAFAAHDLQAQSRTVSGAVAGSDGASIPGATVIVKGGSQGTSTDADGKYTLSVPETAKALVFSFVGYDSKEVAIGDQSTINVTLKVNTTGLDEVVVVGYGTQARRDLTGSVASVSGKQIATAPVQSFDQALQGRASGVNITTPNGVLNNPPVIRIRGVNSISLSSGPLIVIDGIPAFSGNSSAVGSVPNNPLSNLNPADIESMDVLKDASATAIYGSRAAGGVILVTTKKGRRGQSHLSYDTWVGWSKPVRLYEVLGAQDYVTIKNEAVRNLNANRKSVGAAATNVEGFKLTDANGVSADTRWYDYIYRTGFAQSHNLNFSGGTEKTTFYSSVGYTDQKGMIVNNAFQRVSARLNVDHKVFSNFSVGMRVGYSNTHNSSPNTGSVGDNSFGSAGLGRVPILLPPNLAPYNPDGTPNASGPSIGAGPNINPATGGPFVIGFINPVVDLAGNRFNSDGSEIQGSVSADWEVIKGLNLRTQYGINNIAFEDQAFYTSLAGTLSNPGGEADNYYRTNKRTNWQNTAQYDRSFNEKHNFSLLLGNEQQTTNVQRWGAVRTGVADPFFTTFQGNFTTITPSGNFQGANYLVSFFGRLNYNFDRKYLATVNVRRDGYSAFAKKYGNFYGASLGYVVSEEGFWKNAAFAQAFSLLKITGSFGKVGNNQGIDDFVSLNTYASGFYGANSTLYFSNAGNPNLAWEVSRKSDIGASFGFLQDRLRGDFSYYNNLVDGLILSVPQAPSKGIPLDRILGNVGSMRNTGVELNLTYNAFQDKAFNWTVSGNVTTLKNRVLSLATEGQRLPTSTGGLETANFTQVGNSAGQILAVKSLGVNPANGQRMIQKADGTVAQYNHSGLGWTNVADGKPTAAPNQLTDGVYYGPVLPTFYGGFDNTFRYKGLDLGLFVQFSGGNYIYNGTKSGLHDQRFWNNEVDIMDRWTETNTNAKWPRVVYTDNVSNGSALVMSSNVEKGDFARLRQVSLGYSIAQPLLERVKVANARIYVQVQNAALLTKYSGIDPEISTNGANNTGAGVDRNSVGQARTYTVGFNIGF